MKPRPLKWEEKSKAWISPLGQKWAISIHWHYYKPLPILSRDKMIAKINEIAADHIIIDHTDKPFIGGKCGEKILDAILKSGLPEKKVEIKKTAAHYYLCSNYDCCEEEITINHKFCPSCGSKIKWV